MGEARKHHYICAAYLEGFTAADGRLCVLDLQRNQERHQRPREVAHIRDYHRIDIAEFPPNSVEAQMGEIEGHAVAAIRRIAAQAEIEGDDDLGSILAFIALHAARVPRVRDLTEGMYANASRRVLQLATATEERWTQYQERMRAAGVEPTPDVTYAQIKEFVGRGEFTIAMDNNTNVAGVLHQAALIGEQLRRRNWCLVDTTADAGPFITSDDPTALTWSVPMPPPFGPGFGLAQTDVTFPLSSRTALFGRFEPMPSRIAAEPELVATINSRTAHGARQVFAPHAAFLWQDSAGQTRHGGLLAASALDPPQLDNPTTSRVAR